MITIGIDPGKKTGLAVFRNKRLIELHSFNTFEALIYIINNAQNIERIVIEDSGGQSYIWNDNNNRKAFGRHARNIGSVDGKVGVFKEACESLKIDYIPISPLKKGAKWTKEQFKVYFPYWVQTTNEHERDAVKVVVQMGYVFW